MLLISMDYQEHKAYRAAPSLQIDVLFCNMDNYGFVKEELIGSVKW